MKFILLMFVNVFNTGGGDLPALGSAEFDDRPACQAAGEQWTRSLLAAKGTTPRAQFICVPKSSAAEKKD